MAGFGDLVQKAFYLGVGAASYAAEKAGSTLSELRVQAQKLADELVAKGEITAEEAKRMVDEMVIRAQQTPPSSPGEQPAEPRQIEILADDEPDPDPDAQAVENLRDQISQLQDELRRLKRD
jgi:polyhydroxyalkanoate synthesis regulator phasin